MNFDVGNKIIYNTELLKSNLCDYNDTYILVRGDITVTVVHATQVAFKNCASFTKYITKTDGTIIDDDEDLDLVMPMYNLLELKMMELILIITLRILMNLSLSSIRLNYWGTQLLNLHQIKLMKF